MEKESKRRGNVKYRFLTFIGCFIASLIDVQSFGFFHTTTSRMIEDFKKTINVKIEEALMKDFETVFVARLNTAAKRK